MLKKRASQPWRFMFACRTTGSKAVIRTSSRQRDFSHDDRPIQSVPILPNVADAKSTQNGTTMLCAMSVKHRCHVQQLSANDGFPHCLEKTARSGRNLCAFLRCGVQPRRHLAVEQSPLRRRTDTVGDMTAMVISDCNFLESELFA